MPTSVAVLYFIGKPRRSEVRLLVRANPFDSRQAATIQTGVSIRFVAGWAQFLEDRQKSELLAALNALGKRTGLEGISAEFDPELKTDVVLLRFNPAVDMNVLIEAVVAAVGGVIRMQVDPHYLGLRPDA